MLQKPVQFLALLASIIPCAHATWCPFWRSKAPGAPTYDYVSSDDPPPEEIGDCKDGTRVWIFKPRVPKEEADVVIYLHGYSAAYPSLYNEHIVHLVRQGNYVIFPQFQEGFCNIDLQGGLLSGVGEILGEASQVEWAQREAETSQQALDTLSSPYNNVYLYGHSLGGAIGMIWGDLSGFQETVTAGVFSSPQPSGFDGVPEVVTTLLPFFFGEAIDFPAAAPNTTFPVAVLHANDDTIAPLEDIEPTFEALGSDEKALYQAQTDNYGCPALTADHILALSICTNDLDTFDYRYLWFGLDTVMQGAPVEALDFDLGQWSDGQAVAGVERLI